MFVSDAGPASDRSWIEPWDPVDDPDPLIRELTLEVGPGHVLFRRPVVALGRRRDTDDVLFEVRDEAYGLARVHLTWTSRPEEGDFPRTELFASWEDWVARMLADREAR